MRLFLCAVLCATAVSGCSSDSPACPQATKGVASERLLFKTHRAEPGDPALQGLAPLPGPSHGLVSSFGNGELVMVAGSGACLEVSSVTVTSDHRAILEFKTRGGSCASVAFTIVVVARTKPTTPKPSQVLLLQGCRPLT